MKKTLKTALVLTAIGALALTGCSGKSGDSSNQKKRQQRAADPESGRRNAPSI